MKFCFNNPEFDPLENVFNFHLKTTATNLESNSLPCLAASPKNNNLMNNLTIDSSLDLVGIFA
jgi:hypothetical protein